MTIDDAIAAGERGMQLAQAGAGEWFAEQAQSFIRRFASGARRPFSAEELVETARASGLVTRDERAWGPAFMRAARSGVIRRSSVTYRRTKGHGTLGVMWESALP